MHRVFIVVRDDEGENKAEVWASWLYVAKQQEVVDTLLKHTVPVAPVFDIPQVVDSPQVAARHMLVTIDDPLAGPRRVVGNPIKSSAERLTPTDPAPALGQHTKVLLTDLLGLSSAELERLAAEGII